MLENLIGEFTLPGVEKRDGRAEGLDEGQWPSPEKSVSVHECFPFIWPYNALLVDVDWALSPSLLVGDLPLTIH